MSDTESAQKPEREILGKEFVFNLDDPKDCLDLAMHALFDSFRNVEEALRETMEVNVNNYKTSAAMLLGLLEGFKILAEKTNDSLMRFKTILKLGEVSPNELMAAYDKLEHLSNFLATGLELHYQLLSFVGQNLVGAAREQGKGCFKPEVTRFYSSENVALFTKAKGITYYQIAEASTVKAALHKSIVEGERNE